MTPLVRFNGSVSELSRCGGVMTPPYEIQSFRINGVLQWRSMIHTTICLCIDSVDMHIFKKDAAFSAASFSNDYSIYRLLMLSSQPLVPSLSMSRMS